MAGENLLQKEKDPCVKERQGAEGHQRIFLPESHLILTEENLTLTPLVCNPGGLLPRFLLMFVFVTLFPFYFFKFLWLQFPFLTQNT